RFKLRNAPATRDEAAYQGVLVKRRALHALILQAMTTQKLDALAYPVNLQKPPRLGEDPHGGGGSCQLSASTGLPVIAIPLGFVPEKLPIGLELMGADFAEPTLIKLAYAWEQAAKPRKAPFSTPRLQNGHAPLPAQFILRAAEGGVSVALQGIYS